MKLVYHCGACSMSVNGSTCAKCGSELVHMSITTEADKEVQVCECPKGCGKIKSPMCCGEDMEVKQV